MAFLFERSRASGNNLSEFGAIIGERVRAHKGWYVVQGIIFIIFGILAAILPAATAIGVDILVGAILLISGIFQLVASLKVKMHWWSTLSSLLSIIIGGLMLWNPFTGIVALVLLVAVFLLIEGVIEVLIALQFRPVKNWGWILFSGITALLLSAILWFGFPFLGMVFIGYMVAINLIFYGVSLLMLARSV
jgi:uncharacterized membrane protein HdeD (DUF308 family)